MVPSFCGARSLDAGDMTDPRTVLVRTFSWQLGERWPSAVRTAAISDVGAHPRERDRRTSVAHFCPSHESCRRS